jgi:hypothetical protein
MKRISLLLALIPIFFPALLADFSNSVVALHPSYPESKPFLISISGTRPTDCHPGEQLPVIRAFDGYTVEIEFETIVVHVTCNEVVTPYRSLVDMNEALNTTRPLDHKLRVRVDFDGSILDQSLNLSCPEDDDCSEIEKMQILPERGLYTTSERAMEGLLVARQNQTAVLYPLVYDEAGNAVWLFSAAPFVEGTFLAQLMLWHGGDCFDCEPTDTGAQPSEIGTISVFAERPDTIWVKLGDRPFSEYHKLVYGYEVFDRDEGEPLTDLTGRWALSENFGTHPPLGDLSEILPPTFEIALEYTIEADGNSAGPASVVYQVTSITDQEIGQLICELGPSPAGYLSGCELIDQTDQAEPLLIFIPQGPSTLSIEYGRTLPDIGIRPGGKAVRLD